MGSQYLLPNNDSSEMITVKFEHCSAIQIRIHKRYHIVPIRFSTTVMTAKIAFTWRT